MTKQLNKICIVKFINNRSCNISKMVKKNRAFYERFLLNYYTKVNKPKGVSIKDIRENISNSQLTDLIDEYRLVKQVSKKSKLTK